MAATETLIVNHDYTTLDLLLWRRFLRATPGLVERVLDLNPGLADLGTYLPFGTRVVIEIPDAAKPDTLQVISLWD